MSSKKTRWPCVLASEFVKVQLNPRLYELDPKTPFGAFVAAWRQEHCRRVNPHGSEDCPYPERDCALAYYTVARRVLTTPDVRSRVGLFRTWARNAGAERADEKPLARDKLPAETHRREMRERAEAPDRAPMRRLSDLLSSPQRTPESVQSNVRERSQEGS